MGFIVSLRGVTIRHGAAFATAVVGAAVLAQASTASAAEVGDGGLHEQPWFVDSFRDVAEDVELAAAEGRALLILYEQRDCPFCAKLHATLLDDPDVSAALQERFDVVQYDLLGATEVTDLDGTVLTEASAAERWGIQFTPTMLVLDEAAVAARDGASTTAREAAITVVPGVPEREALLALAERVGGTEAPSPD